MFFGEHEVGFVFAVCLVGPVVVFGGCFGWLLGVVWLCICCVGFG